MKLIEYKKIGRDYLLVIEESFLWIFKWRRKYIGDFVFYTYPEYEYCDMSLLRELHDIVLQIEVERIRPKAELKGI